jgi:Flp pilus assembly protein TadD
VRLRPDSARVHSLRGWLYEKLGRRELAHADYEMSAALSKSDAWLARALERTR